MTAQGARAKLAVIDASRRNPYERRFRSFSHGLAPISAPDNALILTSATPGKVADDSKGANSVLVSELLNNFNSQAGVESVFNKTRVSISRASDSRHSSSRKRCRGFRVSVGRDTRALVRTRASLIRSRRPTQFRLRSRWSRDGTA